MFAEDMFGSDSLDLTLYDLMIPSDYYDINEKDKCYLAIFPSSNTKVRSGDYIYLG